MDGHDLIDVVPPGARPRPAVPFKGNLPLASVVVVCALGIVAVTWRMLWFFDQSLHVTGTQLTIARVIEVVIAVGTVAVGWFGVLAFIASLGAQRLAGRGEFEDARIALEDSRDRMWVVVGLGLTALVVAFLCYLLGANDGRVRDVMFDWEFLWSRTHTGLLRGFWWNIKLFVVSELLVLPWSLIVAVVRMLPGRACAPIRILAIAYIDVFRGIPAIITIYLIVFGFSIANVPLFDQLHGDGQLFWLSVLALVLVYGAYVAEVYRAGLESIHWSQTAAARSLGLSQVQTLRFVVVPQAVRRIIPPLLNDFVALQKDSALVSIIGLVEVLGASQLYKGRFFNLSPVTGAAMCFLVITIPFTRFVDYLIKRDRERTDAQ